MNMFPHSVLHGMMEHNRAFTVQPKLQPTGQQLKLYVHTGCLKGKHCEGFIKIQEPLSIKG
jgi:hypothetical protein